MIFLVLLMETLFSRRKVVIARGWRTVGTVERSRVVVRSRHFLLHCPLTFFRGEKDSVHSSDCNVSGGVLGAEWECFARIYTWKVLATI
jgi:hypothetical protein